MIINPVGSTHHFHALERNAPLARAKYSIVPQLFPEGSPRPKKLRLDSARMDAEATSTTCTNASGLTADHKCPAMISSGFAPSARAASMYVSARVLKTRARISRAGPAQKKIDNTRMILRWLGPR